MKLAVCVKEVLDARLPLQVLAPSGEILPAGGIPVMLINPSDRTALEVALRIRDENSGSRVEAFSVCEKGREEALYFALARGADFAERLVPSHEPLGPPGTALRLAHRLANEHFDLVCCGDETLDNSSAMVGPLLAELLDLPQVTSACNLRECQPDRLVAERRLDRGHRELVEARLPAVVTFTTDTTDPQYVSYARIERARQKRIPVWGADGKLPVKKVPIWPASESRMPPRARVKKKFTVDSALSAADRIKMIMAGGVSKESSAQNSSLLEGDPEFLSEQLFRFLKHHEFI